MSVVALERESPLDRGSTDTRNFIRRSSEIVYVTAVFPGAVYKFVKFGEEKCGEVRTSKTRKYYNESCCQQTAVWKRSIPTTYYIRHNMVLLFSYYYLTYDVPMHTSIRKTITIGTPPHCRVSNVSSLILIS